jgi:effector-binding domain-containing protein
MTEREAAKGLSTARHRGRGWIAAGLVGALALVASPATHGVAQQANPSPPLPPPGSLVTPPAAPKPGEAPPQAVPPASDQARMPEIGGPTEIMLEARPVLILRGQSTWDDGFDTLMEAFKSLRDEAGRQKIALVGQPQAAFTSTDDHGFKFEAMVFLQTPPVGPEPKVDAKFALGMSPSGRALKFTHGGAYDDIDTTYEAITAYLDEKNLKAKNLFIEEYATEPKASDDADLQMNILVLIE